MVKTVVVNINAACVGNIKCIEYVVDNQFANTVGIL